MSNVILIQFSDGDAAIFAPEAEVGRKQSYEIAVLINVR